MLPVQPTIYSKVEFYDFTKLSSLIWAIEWSSHFPCLPGVQGADTDEQAFANSIALFMAGGDIRNTLEHFANSCLEHSRHLR